MTSPKQQRAIETRAALLAAARSVFQEKGYRRTTVADIVKRAGRAHGTFYLHFENKRAITVALLEEAITSLQRQSRAMWRHENPTRSVWVTVRRYIEEYRDNSQLWLLLDQMATEDEGFRQIREEWRATFVSRIRRGFGASAATGDGLDLDVLAELFAAMVDEICWASYVEGRRWNIDALALHITTLWSRAVGYAPADLAALWAAADAPGPTETAAS